MTATQAGQFTRIVITAKAPGPDGNGITHLRKRSMSAMHWRSSHLWGAQNTCCASAAGAVITADNPAIPGEIITIFATGLGDVTGAGGTSVAVTGQIYTGPAFNTPVTPVDNAQIGGLSGNVIFAGLEPGQLGVYRVLVQLDPSVPSNAITQMFIAQNIYTSNIVTIPIVSPSPPPATQ